MVFWFGLGALAGGITFDLMWRWLYNATVKMYEDRITLLLQDTQTYPLHPQPNPGKHKPSSDA